MFHRENSSRASRTVSDFPNFEWLTTAGVNFFNFSRVFHYIWYKHCKPCQESVGASVTLG